MAGCAFILSPSPVIPSNGRQRPDRGSGRMEEDCVPHSPEPGPLHPSLALLAFPTLPSVGEDAGPSAGDLWAGPGLRGVAITMLAVN